MIEIQAHLLDRDLAALKERGINSRVSKRDPAVFSLNYDQIDAKDSDELTWECRGLVLRRKAGPVSDGPIGETEILARPFRRFFNLGTGACAPVDFADPGTRFYEKMDGSLCILHADRSEWHVATRSVPDADVPIDGFTGYTFRTLFEAALHDTTGRSFASVTSELDPSRTYLFELTAGENQIVVRYPERRTTLLAIRENVSGVEHDPLSIGSLVPVCPSYRFGSVDEMLAFTAEKDPTKHEGIVACDPAFRRCKVKNPNYLALNAIRDSVARSPRAIMEVILRGKADDVGAALPSHLRDVLERQRIGLGLYLAEVDDEYERLHSPDRKTFAIAIQKSGGWMAAQMARYSGKCRSAREYVEGRVDQLGDTFLDHLVAEAERRA